MDRPQWKSAQAFAEQSQFPIGVKAAMLDPAAEKVILASKPDTCYFFVDIRIRTENPGNCLLHSTGDFFVCVQTQNPRSAGLGDGRILLCGIALPRSR